MPMRVSSELTRRHGGEADETSPQRPSLLGVGVEHLRRVVEGEELGRQVDHYDPWPESPLAPAPTAHVRPIPWLIVFVLPERTAL